MIFRQNDMTRLGNALVGSINESSTTLSFDARLRLSWAVYCGRNLAAFVEPIRRERDSIVVEANDQQWADAFLQVAPAIIERLRHDGFEVARFDVQVATRQNLRPVRGLKNTPSPQFRAVPKKSATLDEAIRALELSAIQSPREDS